MFKLLTTAFVALMFAALPAQAAPSKKIFKGKYDGNAMIENVVGDRIFYSPVRFKISKTGIITGTAYCSGKLLRVKGSIRKVKVLYGTSFTGKASGTFSDGTKWKANVKAVKGLTEYNVITGTASKDAYEGDLTLTRQL